MSFLFPEIKEKGPKMFPAEDIFNPWLSVIFRQHKEIEQLKEEIENLKKRLV